MPVQIDENLTLLIVGCGGREYAIAKALNNSIHRKIVRVIAVGDIIGSGLAILVDEYIWLGNGIENIADVVAIAIENNVNIAVIGPEAPLQAGLADAFWEAKIACIGPSKLYATLETSKGFTRELMQNHGLGQYSPKYEIISRDSIAKEVGEFTDFSDVMTYKLKTEYDNKYVIKADGLRGGKGVKISGSDFKNINEAIAYCSMLMSVDGGFLIEEKLVGDEFSLLSFSDGNTLAHMPVVQDYKRAYVDDLGPNTGGMGSVLLSNGSLPFLTVDDISLAQTINEKVVGALETEVGDLTERDIVRGYIGIVYGSFMKTNKGEIKVIEYNARFGDPEAINLLHVLKSDLLEIFVVMVNGILAQFGSIEYRAEHCVSRYICPNGYPDKPVKGKYLGLSKVSRKNSLIYASIDYNTGMMFGSRAVAVVESGPNIHQVINKLDETLKQIKGAVFYRMDIGRKYCIGPNISVTKGKADWTNGMEMEVDIGPELTYKAAGVNVEEGNMAVLEIKSLVEATYPPGFKEQLPKYGLFAGFYPEDDNSNRYSVSSMDGLGTKVQTVLNLMPRLEAFESLGHDLFNNNFNDLLCAGPDLRVKFFLDYFGCRKLNRHELRAFIKGLSAECRLHNCVLLGGETAELPDFMPTYIIKNELDNLLRELSDAYTMLDSCKYNGDVAEENRILSQYIPKLKNDIKIIEKRRLDSQNKMHTDSYEAVGVIVGSVSKPYDLSQIVEGDIVYALPSSGPHTNGYSLINHLIINNKLDGYRYAREICAPHRSYWEDICFLVQKLGVTPKSLCHITGGGLIDNPPRSLPDGYNIKWGNWDMPWIFKVIQKAGNLSDIEMRRTFNCGIGMLVVVSPEDAIKIKSANINIQPVGTVSK